MKGLVFNAPRDVRYESYDDPKLTVDTGVIVQVERCSICGSDLHIYHGGHIGKTDYSAGVEKFCVGHEFVGEVVEVGNLSHSFKVGDKVLAAGGTGCGHCQQCLSGDPLRCRKATAFGMTADMNGSQAEYVQVPNADKTLMKIPNGVNDEQAMLLTDALATAYFGISRADIKPGDTLVVVGLGPIGLLGVELGLALGASQVFAVDPVANRRAHAEGLGAVAFAPEIARQGIKEATQGRGVNCAFEASGASAAVASVPGFIAAGGTASFIGVPPPDAVLNMGQIIYRNLTVRAGIAEIQKMWPHLVPLLQQGRIKGEGLFTHNMPLSEGAKAYAMFDGKQDNMVKVMMQVR